VTADDVVIMLSNSGETDELLQLLPYIKRREVPLIAIVGNLKSTIAQRADAVLDASVDQEACPLNLAPTASTTVALAIGDALAMTLMQKKGLTETDFASNHPAGQLGKRLTLRVSDLMHGGSQNPTIGMDASWMDIISTITQYGLGAVNVVDGEARLAGIITDGDLRRSFQRLGPRDLAFANLRCDDLMTHNPIVTSPETLAFDALRLMEDRPSQINVLPVVDNDGKCVGLIRMRIVKRASKRRNVIAPAVRAGKKREIRTQARRADTCSAVRAFRILTNPDRWSLNDGQSVSVDENKREQARFHTVVFDDCEFHPNSACRRYDSLCPGNSRQPRAAHLRSTCGRSHGHRQRTVPELFSDSYLR
jgi:arabinose-5-phosphate isomerase